jgi:trehalose utilization protein
MKHYSLILAALSFFAPVVSRGADPKSIRVLVWDEQQPEQKQAYGPSFLGETIAAHLGSQPGITVKTANLNSPEQGVDEATLDASDVVIWWSHKKAPSVTNTNAERVASRVREGKLGFIALHSAHWAKPFVLLMQDRAKTDALAKVPEAERASARWEYLNENPIYKPVKSDTPLTPALTHEGEIWRLTLPQCVFPGCRADGAPSHVTTLLPKHPIAAGLPVNWDIPQTEMYGGPFHVPTPDAVVFEERWDLGEHFPSGCIWQVGKGRVFYFRPGHETYPIYKQAEPLRVIENAVRWIRQETK